MTVVFYQSPHPALNTTYMNDYSHLKKKNLFIANIPNLSGTLQWRGLHYIVKSNSNIATTAFSRRSHSKINLQSPSSVELGLNRSATIKYHAPYQLRSRLYPALQFSLNVPMVPALQKQCYCHKNAGRSSKHGSKFT